MNNAKTKQREYDSQYLFSKASNLDEKVYAHVKLRSFYSYHKNLKIGKGMFFYADVYEEIWPPISVGYLMKKKKEQKRGWGHDAKQS